MLPVTEPHDKANVPSGLGSDGADPFDLEELVSLFVGVEQLERAWASGEVEALERLAHQLQGQHQDDGPIDEAVMRLQAGLKAINGSDDSYALASLRSDFDAVIEACRTVRARG